MQEDVRAGGSSTQKGSAGTREILTFRLGPECYGIDIPKVQEIRRYDAPTALANAPAHIKGVIDLRGVAVPVFDLRIRFGLARAAYDAFTVVVILTVAQAVIGFVVDAVSDVLALRADAVQPAPQVASRPLDTRLISGLATVPNALVILLDVDQLVDGAELAVLDGAMA